MNLKFILRKNMSSEDAHLIIAPNQHINEQQLENKLLPAFYKITPGLDDDSGKLLPGFKIEETYIGPRWILSDAGNDGINHISGISVHLSKLGDTIKVLENLEFSVEAE